MHLARVIGDAHATVKDPMVAGAKMLLIRPMDERREFVGAPLVAVDMVGAGPGEVVFYTTAYEAVIPWKRLHPDVPMALIDAGIIGIVDRIDLAETSS